MRLSDNTTFKPLNNDQTFTGIWADVSSYASVTIACKTDTSCKVYLDFSPDGHFTDSTLTYEVSANINEVHRVTVTRVYARVRVLNDSGSNQTFLRLSMIAGPQDQLTSSLNSIIQRDADALTVRPTDFNLLISEGLYENTNVTIKDGFNLDVDTGSVPQDITNEGGVYAGFPTGTPEAGEIIVSGADTGTIFYSYMATPQDTDYVFGSLAITGANTYALGHNIWRSNFAFFIASSPTATNVGTITLRNTVTTTNIFWQIPIGYGQTFCSAYTVPFGSEVFIDRITGSLRGNTNGTLDGIFWYRDSINGGFRYRFPFELQFGSLYSDDVDYLIRIPSGVDIIPRITASSTNNLQAKISYRILKIK